MKPIPQEFIRAIPKTDLHVHLDGSLRLETILDLARQAHVQLPADTAQGLLDNVFRERYDSLEAYLAGFHVTVAVLQTAAALERAALELAEDCLAEGVRYLEVRFAPQLHAGADLTIPDVLAAVDRGLARARQVFNGSAAVRDGPDVPFDYGIIVCALRMFGPEFSPYYRRFVEAHTFSSVREIHSLASLEVARAAVRCRDQLGLPIVAFDLAGSEQGYPAEHHERAYAYVHKHFMKKTVHAGEAYGPESIFQAITDLHADRIGHGLHLFRDDLIRDRTITDPQRYVRDLVQYIADRRITIEICLTSNLQTIPELTDLAQHAMRRMVEERLSVTLCTDNRLVSQTSVTQEVTRAVEAFGLDARALRNIIIYGFKRSFFPGVYKDKRTYVRRVIERYDHLQKSFGIS